MKANKILQMKANKIFLNLLIIVLLVPLMSVGFIKESESVYGEYSEIEIVYIYDGEKISEIIALSDEPICLLDVKTFSDLLKLSGKEISDIENFDIVWHINSENGEIAENNFKITKSVSLYGELIKIERTITYEYIYNFFSHTRFRSVQQTYGYGENVVIPKIYGSDNYALYSDERYTHKVSLDNIAYENKVYYVKLNKTVEFTLNGETIKGKYGAPLSSISCSPEFRYEKFYIDENHTEEYKYFLFDGLKLYAEKVKISYIITLIKGNNEDKIYIPLNDNILTKEHLKSETYFYPNGEKVTLPVTITSDMTLYTEIINDSENTDNSNEPPSSEKADDKDTPHIDNDNSDNNNTSNSEKDSEEKLSDNEKIITIVISSVLLAIVILSLLYEKIIKKSIAKRVDKKL